MSRMTAQRIERMAESIGMRRSRPRAHPINNPHGEHDILSAEAIETIHEWEDVDADELRAACARGEVLNSDA